MMDQMITRWINGWAGTWPTLDAVAIAIAAYGIYAMVGLVALQWFARRDRPFLRHVAVSACGAFFVGLGLNQLILLAAHRVRPYDMGVTHLIIAKSTDWSFPSDHATAAAAIAAVVLIKGVWGRGVLLAWLAVLVCWSRVYVGIHYAGDVAGGVVVGIAAAGLVAIVYRRGNRVDRALTQLL